MTQAEFQEILKLCKEFGGRYIFVENGKPQFVLMNMEEFRKIFSKKTLRPNKVQEFENSKEELIERINREIAQWYEAQKEKDIENILDEENFNKKENFSDEKEEANYYYEV